MPDPSSLYPYAIFRAAVLYAESDTVSRFWSDALILVHREGVSKGRIMEIGAAEEIALTHGIDLNSVVKMSGILLPAFYDLHFHWVQDDVREMPKVSLLEWLEQYTFPAEARFADREYARDKAAQFWRRIVSVGTIGGLCYSSIHEVALEAAMEQAPEGFKIGNVLMTMNCPESVRQSETEAIQSVARCAKRYKDRYVASPRFAPTTAPAVLSASAQAAESVNCYQQTHLSENLAEIEWVLEIYRKFPGYEDVTSYTDIYQRAGMLGEKSVFGHCIHLSAEEWQLMADTNSIIASCPSSNAPISELGLGSGLFDFQQAEAYGVRWSLCSDIGGGPFLSMFDVMRSFVAQNRAAGINAGYVQALYRSTRAGAELLGLGERKGLLSEGFDFDCIRVPVGDAILASGDVESILAQIVTHVANRNEYDSLVQETIIRGESRFNRTGSLLNTD